MCAGLLPAARRIRGEFRRRRDGSPPSRQLWPYRRRQNWRHRPRKMVRRRPRNGTVRGSPMASSTRFRLNVGKLISFRPNIVFRGAGKPFSEDKWRDILIDTGAGEAMRITLVSRCTRCMVRPRHSFSLCHRFHAQCLRPVHLPSRSSRTSTRAPASEIRRCHTRC